MQNSIKDLVDRNLLKNPGFGAPSTTSTFDDKNIAWKDIVRRLSEQHGKMLTKDDVSESGVISK